MTCLALESVPSPKHLTMQHAPRLRPLKCVEAVHGRYPRHIEMSTSNNNPIKPLRPPLFLYLRPGRFAALDFPPQRQHPLPTIFHHLLHKGAILHQGAVPSPVE